MIELDHPIEQCLIAIGLSSGKLERPRRAQVELAAELGTTQRNRVLREPR